MNVRKNNQIYELRKFVSTLNRDLEDYKKLIKQENTIDKMYLKGKRDAIRETITKLDKIIESLVWYSKHTNVDKIKEMNKEMRSKKKTNEQRMAEKAEYDRKMQLIREIKGKKSND